MTADQIRLTTTYDGVDGDGCRHPRRGAATRDALKGVPYALASVASAVRNVGTPFIASLFVRGVRLQADSEVRLKPDTTHA